VTASPADEPIARLADARSRLNAVLDSLAPIVAWVSDQLGESLVAYGLRRQAQDVAMAAHHALEAVRDRDPAPDTNDERSARSDNHGS